MQFIECSDGSWMRVDTIHYIYFEYGTILIQNRAEAKDVLKLADFHSLERVKHPEKVVTCWFVEFLRNNSSYPITQNELKCFIKNQIQIYT